MDEVSHLLNDLDVTSNANGRVVPKQREIIAPTPTPTPKPLISNDNDRLAYKNHLNLSREILGSSNPDGVNKIYFNMFSILYPYIRVVDAQQYKNHLNKSREILSSSNPNAVRKIYLIMFSLIYFS